MNVRRRLWIAVLTLALPIPAASASSAAGEPRQASGKFESRHWTFEPFGAYAYPGEVGFDDEPGIVVAISNSSFDAEFFDRYWDRDHAIETYQKDDETLVAFLHFDRAGAYKGMTYYFGSGDGCGFCFDGSVRSTVKVEKGRIHGRVSLAPEPDEIAFDVEFDVPVASAGYGEALPADGGDPGKVYAAYHVALRAADPAALRPFFGEKVQAGFAENAAAIVAAFGKDHPMESYRIVGGFTAGERALLLTEGEVSFGRVKTEVHLERQAGSWRIVEETLQMRLGN